MIKLTLKITGLLLIITFCTSASAKSPWAVEKTVTDENTETTADTDSTKEQVNQQDSRPATIEANSPIASVEDIETTAPTVETDTRTEVVQQRGDVLNTPAATQNQAMAVHIVDFPVRGMNTDKVRNELGQPAEILPAIGQPPITRWIYNDRTVYFEYSTVIHAVSN